MEFFITLALSIIFVTLFAGLYIKWVRKIHNYWKVRGIPYETSANMVSFAIGFFKKPIHESLMEQYKRHGRIYGGFEFSTPILTVCEPDLLRDILVKDFHIFPHRRDLEFGDKVVDKMVSILKGEDWKRVRTVITPAFTSRKMRQMAYIINECAQTVIENFGKYSDSGKPVDVKGIFGAFTLDVIARSAFATKINAHADPDNEFVKHAKEGFAEPSFFRMLVLIAILSCPRWITKWFNLNFLFPTYFFKNVILEVVKERKKSGKRYDDILQLFLDAQDEFKNETMKENYSSDANADEADHYGSVTSNGSVSRLKYKKLTEEELVAQCILFFVVGYETTASTLSHMAYSLALNPDCQEKLIEEVDEVFEKHEELNYDVIRDMKYLDCVVSETLRMYPSLTRSDRTAVENYKLGNTGLVIEKGIIVGFNIHAMHFDPEFFPNPEKFDPERFLSENVRHPQYAYLPFGAGPRNCLGMRFALMEIKMCMANVLRHYKFKKAETTKVPLEYKKGQGFLSVNELPLVIERRNK